MGAEAARSESSPHLCGDQNFADVADFARGFQPRTAGRLIIPEYDRSYGHRQPMGQTMTLSGRL